MSKLFSFLILAILPWFSTGINNRTITGTVRDAADSSPLPGVSVIVKGSKTGVVTDSQGQYTLPISDEKTILIFSYVGYVTQEISVGKRTIIDVKLTVDVKELSEVVVSGYTTQKRKSVTGSVTSVTSQSLQGKVQGIYSQPSPTSAYSHPAEYEQIPPPHNTEEYDAIHENGYKEPTKQPLSTFSIDVDAASYSNVRRFLQMGQKPPKDAVRIEEMVNYFSYDYPQPTGEVPFSITTELGDCPWEPSHKLLHIGLQGKEIATDNLPPSNLVFLIDVSGSMESPEKLPLLKSAFRLLTDQLRAQDRVAIVVYAGAAGMVLPSTPGNQKDKILAAIDQLEAGGSTAGGAGIELAYKIAQESFRKGGNNRVILATDGDFNVGTSSNAAMERLIEEKRETNIFLTVLGFGMGNYKDSKMEILADKGNGNYAYIDTILEARKVLVNEFGGTLFTIAKDVKLQLEFNPAMVKAYRLIGYENRVMAHEDFNNDKKDAGDLGSGHTVTALYEIVPANAVVEFKLLGTTDDLKYQQSQPNPRAYASKEWLTLKLRYKKPDGNISAKVEHAVTGDAKILAQTSDNFRFSAAVAGFGMLLRDSEFKGNVSYVSMLRLAESAQGHDEEGYRKEFINLMKSSRLLAGK